MYIRECRGYTQSATEFEGSDWWFWSHWWRDPVGMWLKHHLVEIMGHYRPQIRAGSKQVSHWLCKDPSFLCWFLGETTPSASTVLLPWVLCSVWIWCFGLVVLQTPTLCERDSTVDHLSPELLTAPQQPEDPASCTVKLCRTTWNSSIYTEHCCQVKPL